MSMKSAKARAAAHFTKAPGEGELLRQDREAEQRARAAKTERLRALRLAKEAADREAAERLAAAKPSGKSKSRRT